MYKIKRTLGIVSLDDRYKKENHREGKMWAVDSGKRGPALPETKTMQTSTGARQSLGGTELSYGDGDSLAMYQLMDWASFSRNLSLFIQTNQQLHSRTFNKRIVHGDGKKST